MFKCKKMLIGSENYPALAMLEGTEKEEILEGEALDVVDGKVTKASGKPKYIAAANRTGGLVPVYIVSPYAVFETKLTVLASEINVGEKLALSSDGLFVADKAAGGPATIVKFYNDKQIGDYVDIVFE